MLVRGGGLAAALHAASQHGGIEVVLVRRLSPLDPGPILESVSRTGRAVIVDEADGTTADSVERVLVSGAFWRLLSPPVSVVSSGSTEELAAAILAAVQHSLAEGQ